MKINFHNVMPHPLIDFKHPEDSVWGTSFTFNAKEKILLNAESGKGKTTFVNILFGVRKDYNGQLLIDDKAIPDFDEKDLNQLRTDQISVIFQDLQLFPNLTVFENLQIKNNLTNHKSESEMYSYLKALGIENKKDAQCGYLSMGQQQRVAIIRALLQPFQFLLMDEPFSHLDEQNSATALKLIEEEVHKNEAGFLITSLGEKHNFNFDRELII